MTKSSGTEIIETGIKAVDLFAPLVAGGKLAISGAPGVGQVVLALEIVHNVGTRSGSSAVFHVPDVEQYRAALRESMVAGRVVAGPEPARVRISRRGTPDTDLVLEEDPLADSWVVLSRELLRSGQLPAVDAAKSGTRATLAVEHRSLAAAARTAIAGQRGGMVLAFLRQWFKVGEPWTGQPAEYSPLANTLDGVRRLLPRPAD